MSLRVLILFAVFLQGSFSTVHIVDDDSFVNFVQTEEKVEAEPSLSMSPSSTASPAPSFDHPDDCECIEFASEVFSTISFGNFDGWTGSDTQGRLLIGGDATLLSYSISDRLPLSDGQRDDLIVGGNLNFQTGRVFGGNIVYGGEKNVSESVKSSMSTNSAITQDNTRFDFDAAKAHFQDLSLRLANIADTGDLQIETHEAGKNVIARRISDQSAEFFSIDCADLSAAFFFEFTAFPLSADIIVNVGGDNCTMSGMTIKGGSTENIVWNLYEATNVTIEAIEIRGALLAPFANMTGIGATLNGQTVVNVWKGNTQQNIQDCNACLVDYVAGVEPFNTTLARSKKNHPQAEKKLAIEGDIAAVRVNSTSKDTTNKTVVYTNAGGVKSDLTATIVHLEPEEIAEVAVPAKAGKKPRHRGTLSNVFHKLEDDLKHIF